jgi:hypothetical protein
VGMLCVLSNGDMGHSFAFTSSILGGRCCLSFAGWSLLDGLCRAHDAAPVIWGTLHRTGIS